MNKRCIIAGAGEYCGYVIPCVGDYVIAADAGYTEFLAHGITPDLVVGDFDSLGYTPDHSNVIRIPSEKDDTDMMLGIKQGLAKGFTTFIIDGGLGGRLDHTVANFQLLAYIASKGARGYLLGREVTVTAIMNSSISFQSETAGYISVFSIGGNADGVTLTGLKYLLNDATLTSDYPLGVSNEFIGVPATVAVRDGTLIIMWAGRIEAVNNIYSV